MKIHFLDVGTEKYGDCILIQHAGRSILIDGAHSGNYRQQGVTPSLPDQLATLLGPAPFKPDLLVITHVHGDHVGCLPQMVRDGVLRPKKVLAADERWGAGLASDTDADPMAGLPAVDRLIAEALLEEGAADIATEEDARGFIDAFESVEARYNEMLALFAPATVLRFGRDNVAPLETAFASFGLKFLGPTVEHLKLCAAFIGREKSRASGGGGDAVAAGDLDARGRRFWTALQMKRAADADLPVADMAGTGSGKNNQSIVLSVGKAAKKVLLAGDMQFAKAEVPGLRDIMAELLATVAAHGPYLVVKTSHHTSYNGFTAAELDTLGGDPVLVHTGGTDDPGHPEKNVLAMLAERLGPKHFARTDRNGLIGINLSSTKPGFTLGRGAWNDFTPNPKPPPKPKTPRPPEEKAGGPEISIERKTTGDFVEVIARIPHTTTRVTITVDVQPGGLASADAVSAQGSKKNSVPLLKIEGGQRMRRLLVLTNERRLGEKIGEEAARTAVVALEKAGAVVLTDVPVGPDPAPAMERSRAELVRGDYKGVLIIGGYDVLPASRFSVIDDDVRANIQADADDYIVWSDDGYVSLDEDGFPDLPISRVPDAGSAELVFTALGAGEGEGMALSAFGLRNKLRPFADRVFAQLGTTVCRQSWPDTPEAIEPALLEARHLYFMLHGHYIDGDQYTGEELPQVYCEAINRTRIPEAFSGVVLAGCCYGALLTRYPAADTRVDKMPPMRAIDESMALSFLRAGAQAFVGCTAVHYSPPDDAPGTNGEPMHSAFWRHRLAGAPPAEALFLAKRDYVAGIPHSGADGDDYAEAVETKILFQFTCLGLGW